MKVRWFSLFLMVAAWSGFAVPFILPWNKAASDVDCIAEVSPDLAGWFSGPAYTEIADLTDLGARERVTVRDLTPVSAQAARFMRLRLLRHFP